jgi:hypothetical protein
MTIAELIEELQKLQLPWAEVILWDEACRRAPLPQVVNEETVVL